MADIANAAIAASIIVGMVSMPAASQSIETGNNVSNQLSNISMTEEVPKEESTQLSSDSFTRTVESAFSSFSSTVSSGEVGGELETPNSRLEIETQPGKKIWTYTSPQGEYQLVRKTNSVVEKTETPQGTLEIEKKNGNIKKSFQGSDREEVEKVADQLKREMEQKRKEFRERSSENRIDQYRQGLDLEVQDPKKDYEKAVISNEMSREVDLTGWTLFDNSMYEQELSTSLKPDQTLYVYSSNEEEIEDNLTEKDRDKYVYGANVAWNDEDETAKLLDSEDRTIQEFNY